MSIEVEVNLQQRGMFDAWATLGGEAAIAIRFPEGGATRSVRIDVSPATLDAIIDKLRQVRGKLQAKTPPAPQEAGPY